MSTLLLLTGTFISVALFILTLTLLSNLLFFPRLRRAQPEERPFLSILIPARNEAGVIGATVRALLAQSDTNFELIVLDDGSTDGTAAAAIAAANDDERFQVINGRSLPTGWLGKNWACWQLGQAAQGELLLFTDADVQWQPGAIRALLAMQQREAADLLTVWPTQQTETWAERLVVPLMAVAILAYLPILPVHFAPWPVFAAANGQCLLFRRAAYERIGGHAPVRGDVVEDVALARRIKAHGLRLRMADGSGLVRCRMYRSWPEVRDGFAKNLLAGHGGSVLFLLLSTIFHWLIFVFPWIWFILTLGAWPLILLLAGVGVRAGTATFTRQRPLDALLMPVSVVLMTRIAVQSIWWRRTGQAAWKGRKLIIG